MTGTLAPDTLTDAPLTIGGRSFRSRLMVGTGKSASNGDMVRAVEAPVPRSSRWPCGGWTSTGRRRKGCSTT